MPKNAEVVIRTYTVRVVEQRGPSAVVEWVDDQGSLRRAIIPAPESELVDEETLQLGIPYGLPWERVITLQLNPVEALARALRTRGIWTVEDLRRNIQASFGALQEVYGADLAALIRAAENYTEE